MKKNSLILTLAVLFTTAFTGSAQIAVDNTTQTPEQLVQNVLVGTGVVVSNIEFNYSVPLAQTTQTQCGYFDATGTTFPITEGLILGSGDVTLAIGPNNSPSATNNNGVAPDPNDPDLNAISTTTINNEAILEFDFVPSGDSVVFNYVFASEEYPEYSPSSYNDAFGFFISGPGFSGPYTNGAENIALIPGTTTPVTINNVGDQSNTQFYVDNTGGADLQYDGHTVVFQAVAAVQCGETYHIKLAIGDAGDQSFDSAVFLEANSFSSNGVSVEIASATGAAAITEACDSAIVTFIRPEDQIGTILTIDYGIGGTATNGVDYGALSGQVTFPVGEDTVQFYVTPFNDGLTEGIETVTLTVEIVNECGDTITTEATIEITDPLPFNVLTTDVNLDCATPTIDISANTDGGIPSLVYDWGPQGMGQTISVPGNIVGTTTYNVDVTDACGVTSSGSIDVTLNPAPVPTINFNQNTFTICPGESANIDATVVNPYDPGAIVYDWQPTGDVTEDITVSPNTLTWYYLSVNDGCYDVIDSVKVEMGTITLTDISIVNAQSCPGLGGFIPGEVHVTPDDPTYTYTLTGPSTYGPQNDGDFTTVDPGSYFLNVVNADGCMIDTAITIGTDANIPTPIFVLDSLREVTCYGSNDGGAYVMNIESTPSPVPPYDVVWTSPIGIHFQETVSGVAGGDGDSEVDDLFGGQWIVTVTDDDGCPWSTVFTIDEPDELTLEFTVSEPTCYQFNDGSVTVNTEGGNGGNTFTIWNSAQTQLNSGNTNTVNQLVTGWYYASIEDNKGCFIEDSIFVDQPGQLDIDLTVNQPTCYGIPSGYAEVDTVYNYNGDYNNISYYWNPNPSGNPNGTGGYWINHMGPGTYTLLINDEDGCDRSFDVEIEYPDSLYFTEIGYDPAYCRQFGYQSGNGVVYAAASGGTPDYDYLWVNDGTGETSTNTTWGGLNPGSYTMTVFDDNQCSITRTVLLDSLNPEASFDVASAQFLTPGVYEGTAVVDVSFTNTSTGFANPNNPNADTTFYWNFGFPNEPWKLTHDYLQTFDTTYTSAGEYPFCLVAINKNGCVDTACATMIIHDPLQFTPVNFFTPNGDGVNDEFTFANWAQAVDTFYCVIVNRWGVTVAYLNDINDSWDGVNLQGNPCPDGIYYYNYEGVSTDGTAFSGQGFVNIIDSGN